MNPYLRAFLTLTLTLLLAAAFCTAEESHAGQPMPAFDAATAPEAPDYASAEAWLSRPDNPDQFGVDIFWVYPTVLGKDPDWLMNIRRPDLRTMAARTLTTQASVFSRQANLYAPLYRQMNVAALGLPESKQKPIAEFGAKDVLRAFRHYLKYDNNGRPFILAAHSQGAKVLTEMAVAHWGEFGAEDRLVAAYLVGWSITGQDLKSNPAMKICRSADQTGCFLSYNTMAAGKQPQSPTLRPGSIAVNPLSWTTDTDKMPASANIGATFFEDSGDSKTFPGYASAQIVDGAVIVEAADPSLLDNSGSSFPDGVYHIYDYSIFYENVRANAAQRIQKTLASQ